MVVLKRHGGRRARRRPHLRRRQGRRRRQRRARHERDGAPRRGSRSWRCAAPTRRRASRPSTVGLIEAHGTATPVGDVVEVQALARSSARATGELPPTARSGTVKSMISHTIPASGVAGRHQARAGALPPGASADAQLRRAQPEARAREDAVLHQHRDAAVDSRRRPSRGAPASTRSASAASTRTRCSRRCPPTLPLDHLPPWDSEVCMSAGRLGRRARRAGERLHATAQAEEPASASPTSPTR